MQSEEKEKVSVVDDEMNNKKEEKEGDDEDSMKEVKSNKSDENDVEIVNKESSEITKQVSCSLRSNVLCFVDS